MIKLKSFNLNILKIVSSILFLAFIGFFMSPSVDLAAAPEHISDVSPTAITIPAVSVTEVSFTGSPVGISIPTNEAYTVVSDQAINVGVYQAKLSLITPSSYTWNDDTVNDQFITWEVIPKVISQPAVGITQFAFSFFDNAPDIMAYPGSISTSEYQSQAGIHSWVIELEDPDNTVFKNTTQTAFEFAWEITPMVISVPAIGVTEFAFTGFLNQPEVSPFPGSESTGEMVSTVGIHTYTVELIDPPNMRFSNGTNAAFTIQWSITPSVVTVPSILVTRFAFSGDLNRPGLEVFEGSVETGERVSDVGIYTYTVELEDPVNTVFSNGTTSAFSVAWEIYPLTVITKPSVSVTMYGFTGFVNFPEIEIYDETTLTGTTIASQVGIYTAYARVDNPTRIQFQDGTTEVAIQWRIDPMIVSRPAVVITSFAFGDLVHQVGAFIAPGSIMTNGTAVAVGSYLATVSLDDPGNLTWPDGDTTPIEIPWEITELVISVPAVSVTQYAFQGAANYPMLEVYPGSKATGDMASQVGIYTYTVELIDPDNTVFSDGTKTPFEVIWEIVPRVVSVPAVLVTQFAFSGFDNYPGVNVYPGSEATSDLVSQVGIHTYTVELIDDKNLIFSNGQTTPFEIIWEITPMRVEKPNVSVTSYAFTGDILGPGMPSLPVTRDAISSTDVGIYTVNYRTVDPANIQFMDGSTSFEVTYAITKAIIDASLWAWEYENVFAYTGEVYSVQLINVPNSVEVTYQNHQASEAGIYSASVELNYDEARINIINPPATLEWEIAQKESIAIPNIQAQVFTFDGSPQQPNVPSITGVNVSVSSQIIPGEYRGELVLDDPETTQWSDGSTSPKSFEFSIEPRVVDLSNVQLSQTEFISPDVNLELINIPEFVEVTWNASESPGVYELDMIWTYNDSHIIINDFPEFSYVVYPALIPINDFNQPVEIMENKTVQLSTVDSNEYVDTIDNILSAQSLQLRAVSLYAWDVLEPSDALESIPLSLPEDDSFIIFDGNTWTLLDPSETPSLSDIDLIGIIEVEPKETMGWLWITLGAIPLVGAVTWLILKRR